MNKTMEVRRQSSSCRVSTSPDVFPTEHHEIIPSYCARRFGDVIPHRIFVGGIDYKSELLHIFCQHDSVKDARIVIDRFGLSKGEAAVLLPVSCGALQQASFPQKAACHLWPSLNQPLNLMPLAAQLAAPSVMLTQSHQPVFQHFACHQYQCVPDQCQWNVNQSPVMYSQSTPGTAEEENHMVPQTDASQRPSIGDLVEQECRTPQETAPTCCQPPDSH